MPDTAELAAGATAPAALAELRRVAIVPALNEQETVARVIDELRAFDPGLDVVVVDDGSVDRTADVAAARGARVLRLPFNLGIGGAVQTGFRFAFEHGADFICVGMYDFQVIDDVNIALAVLNGKLERQRPWRA